MRGRALLLTSWYFPHKIIRWQDAVRLYYQDKADIVASYDEVIRSPSTSMQMPAVVRLRRHLSKRKSGVKFSRINVYARDDFRCQYCGKRFRMRQLSYDHVVPRACGGRTTWDNIVTACRPCNSRKDDRTCDEAGMWPLKEPVRPRSLPMVSPIAGIRQPPPEWLPYLHPHMVA
jgi:5-methylcytosine-specific restriction endonuclease McrA